MAHLRVLHGPTSTSNTSHMSKCWAPQVFFHALLEMACVCYGSSWELCLMSSVGRNLADLSWGWQNMDLFLTLALLVCSNKSDTSLCSSAL